jgi:4-amino-4-deoxy-L-arabinose transferase-like glycosyltransferase
VLVSGQRGSGWSGGAVTIAVRPPRRAIADATLCVSFALHDEAIIVQGNATSPALAAHTGSRALGGRMWVEYLRPGNISWASLAPTIVRHMGLGRSQPGAWVAVLVLVLVLTVSVLAALAVLRGLGARLARVPRMALMCALIATLNAVCWSFITPAFQVPDEPDHFAYVKQLAETGTLPSSSSEQLSQEVRGVLAALHYEALRQRPQLRSLATQAEQSHLEATLTATARESGSPAAGVASSQPPLYYALEALPYSVAGNENVLDRLQLMRLVSALFAAVTAFFVFMFVRETLPGAPWAWPVGGLSVALSPLLGFMSGAVNPDSLLFAASAATFYCLACAFRRGLSKGHAIALAAAVAVGLLAKLNYIGFVPGIAVGVLLLAVQAVRRGGRSARVVLALAAGVATCPAVVYVATNSLSRHPALGVPTGATSFHGSVLGEANYIWQLYLPRLPGTVNDFPGLFTTRQLWFDGYVGLYGWLDTPFPAWVDDLALLPLATIVVLCVRSLYGLRARLRRRGGELAAYAIMAAGLLALIGAASYTAFPATDAEFGQVRYLLPLLAPLGAVLALAARGAGRRLGPAIGALIVIVFLAHDVFSQLQVIARYYG